MVRSPLLKQVKGPRMVKQRGNWLGTSEVPASGIHWEWESRDLEIGFPTGRHLRCTVNSAGLMAVLLGVR